MGTRLIPLVVLVTLGAAPASGLAQVASPPVVRPLPPSGWTVEGQEVEGTVTSIAPQARTLTLDNGEEYVVPPPLREPVATLGAGVNVRLRYGIQGGRNILTALQLRP